MYIYMGMSTDDALAMMLVLFCLYTRSLLPIY
jgi:hypothetical protein